MLWDTHMHSEFSTDSDASLDSMIQAAIDKKLDGICFTDHLDLDYPGDGKKFFLELPDYADAVSAIQKKYAGRFPVRFGIELGLQTHLSDEHTALLSQYDFDFVIGSSHLVNGYDPYYPSFYEGRTEEECYREYFESILENVRAFDGFDVYGHLDYIVRYGPNKNADYSYDKYRDIIDAILILLVQKGRGIELNTAGFKYGLGHPNPTEEILSRYRELGGEIVTIGADAHVPEHVGYAFERVPEILKNAGFTHYTVFEKRKPRFVALP